MLPIDHSATSTPASPGSPCDWANAGSATSSAPKGTRPAAWPDQRADAGRGQRAEAAAGRRRASGSAAGSAATIDTVPASTAAAETASAAAGPNTTTIAAVSSGPDGEDGLGQDRVERERAVQQARSRRPAAAGTGRAAPTPAVGKAAPQTSAVAMIAAAGARRLPEDDERDQPRGVDHRLDEHHARPEPVDQPPAQRRAGAGARAPARPPRRRPGRTSRSPRAGAARARAR